MISILVVDDHPVVRRALVEFLLEMEDMFVVAAVPTGQEALRILETADSVDIILTDFHMPEMNGIELAGEITARYPQTSVILLTLRNIRYIKDEAIAAGAAACLDKYDDTEAISSAIYAISNKLK